LLLVADTAVFHGANHAAIWQVFAHRGMGFFAGSLGGNDTEPGASFAKPPATNATGTISGTVTDGDSGLPLQGITVTLAFQGSGPANPTTVTQADGTYSIPDVPVGTYAKLAIKGKERGKFEAAVQEVGSGPVEALSQLLQDAQKRIDDEHPPHPVPPEHWFSADAPPR